MNMHVLYPWQQQDWHHFINWKKTNKIPHAIIISGIDGIGKLHLAQCFAELLLCSNSTDIPCGTCPTCVLLNSNSHPDLHLIQPEEPDKPIKIEQIRELIDLVNITAQHGGYKIVIINNAQALNIAAANALLKSLEEPVANVILILVTNNFNSLSATIISRCQKISIKTPELSQSIAWLVEQGITDSAIAKVALGFTGGPLKALEVIQGDLLKDRKIFLDDLFSIKKANINLVKAAEKYVNFEIKFVLQLLLLVTIDINKYKMVPTTDLVNADYVQEIALIAKTINLKNLFKYQKELFAIQRNHLKNIRFNWQLVLESLFINWVQVLKL